MATVYIGIGSNLGDRKGTIRSALEQLTKEPGVQSVEASSLYETEPVGGPPGQNRYLNAVARLETTLPPGGLLAVLQRIELQLGRVRRERWGPRTIDLDLLLYDDLVIDTPDLVIPHPCMHERRFVLEPLAAIAPHMVHPVLQRTIAALLDAVRTTSL